MEDIFPKEGMLNYEDIIKVCNIAKRNKVERLVLIANPVNAKTIKESITRNEIEEQVLLYESDFIAADIIFVASLGDWLLKERISQYTQRESIKYRSIICDGLQRISTLTHTTKENEDTAAALLKKIKRTKNYLERKALQREYNAIKRNCRKKGNAK